MSTIQNIAILGATGSIGASTLDVIARHPSRFRVAALTANRQVDELAARERRQALEDRVVLAVDRQQHRAADPHLLHENRPCDDQRLLVGEEEFLARCRRGERRAQPRRADDGGHDAVDARQRRDLDQSFLSGENPAAGRIRA